MPNLKRLYVDATLHPPYGEDESAYEFALRLSKMLSMDGTNLFDGKYTGFQSSTVLEAYALAGSSTHACFVHLEVMINSMEHRKEIFSNLKRLYLFTVEDHTPEAVLEEDIVRMARCFNSQKSRIDCAHCHSNSRPNKRLCNPGLYN